MCVCCMKWIITGQKDPQLLRALHENSILFWTFWVVFGSVASMQLEFDGFLSFSFVWHAPFACLWCGYCFMNILWQIILINCRYGMRTSCCRAKTLVEYFGEDFSYVAYLLYVMLPFIFRSVLKVAIIVFCFCGSNLREVNSIVIIFKWLSNEYCIFMVSISNLF